MEKDLMQLKYSGDAIADDNETKNPNISDKVLGQCNVFKLQY
jgi:hypothetical protein